MSNYVYKTTPHSGEHNESLYTVGCYTPQGKWDPVEDFSDKNQAEKAVHFLNGGSDEVLIGPGITAHVHHLEDTLKVCNDHKNEFLEQRDSARQLAYTLAEYIKATERGAQVAYPVDAIAQVDLARGVAGRYEFPAQGRSIPVGRHKIE